MSYGAVIEADELEQERLDFLGQTFDEGTFGWLRALHPCPGWRCLDIGSGIGGVARWLSDACGNVVATDLDAGLPRAAGCCSRTAATSLSTPRLIRAMTRCGTRSTRSLATTSARTSTGRAASPRRWHVPGPERLGVDVEVSVVGADRPMTGFLLHLLRRMEKLLLASGHTDADLAAWREMVSRGGFHDLGMANVAAWGRRPLEQ